MNRDVTALFLDHSVKKLDQMAQRIFVCLDKLTEDQIWARGAEHENSMGNLILHLCGNVRQWIVSGVGKQPFDRDRDEEFNARGSVSIEELRLLLRSTIDQAHTVLAVQTADNLVLRTTVQGYEASHLECIYHVLCHFSEHTGQIQFITKALSGHELGFYTHLHGGKHNEKTP